MELITIEIRAGGIVVHDGQMQKSRLYATADTLQIYKIGKIADDIQQDTVNWHCQNQCTIRHIPLSMLTKYDCGCGRRKNPIKHDPFLRGLWDKLHCDHCGAVLDDNGECPNSERADHR